MVERNDLIHRLESCELEYVEGQPVGLGAPFNPDGPEAANEIRRLWKALDEALQGLHFYNARRAEEIAAKAGAAKPEQPKPSRHAYEPNRKYPWFCRHCGYPEHETLKHDPEMSDRARKRRQAGETDHG